MHSKFNSLSVARTRSLSPIRSLLQKNYGNPKPVREYKRFLKGKIADTGDDPKGSRLEFIKHDIIRPLERVKASPERPNIDINKWSLNTQKQCASLDSLPKLQQYKEYNFPNRKEGDNETYRSHFLKTDNVSIRVPKISKKDDKESFLNMKSIHTYITYR